jgi:sigma-B regulation protein RsbU (phosphoserine phosphatase)
VLLKKLMAHNRELGAAKKELEKYQREMELQLQAARDIQQSLFPRDFANAEIALSGRVEELNGIGGDFYDFYPLDRGRYAIILTDVSGHGINAALVAMQMKFSFAHDLRAGKDLTAICKSINEHFFAVYGGSGVFFTAILGVVDTANRVFEYSSAGHHPFYIIDGESVQMSDRIASHVMGIQDESDFHTHRLPLKPGMKLILVTDGILEARTRDGTFEENIGVVLQNLAGEPVEKILDVLISNVLSLGLQADDITAIGCQIPR